MRPKAGRPARILLAGLAYFALVFAIAFCLGAVRVFALEPVMSRFAATAIEAPFLLAAMLLAAFWLPPLFALRGDAPGLFLVGLEALVLQQLADYSLGRTLRDLTAAEQYAQFARPEGWVLAALLVVFLFAPLALHARGKTPSRRRAPS